MNKISDKEKALNEEKSYKENLWDKQKSLKAYPKGLQQWSKIINGGEKDG